MIVEHPGFYCLVELYQSRLGNLHTFEILNGIAIKARFLENKIFQAESLEEVKRRSRNMPLCLPDDAIPNAYLIESASIGRDKNIYSITYCEISSEDYRRVKRLD